MTELNVVIIRQGDPPAWPELNDTPVAQSHRVRVAVVEGGMVSGRASVGIRVDLEGAHDGMTVIGEVSLAHWIATTAVMRGAFPTEFDDTPLGKVTDELHDKILESLGNVAQLAAKGLNVDGAQHKQWYLEQILAALELRVDDGHTPGVAP